MTDVTDLGAWQQLSAATHADAFWWMTGFEGSHIPLMDADEYRWTQHDRLWADDFVRVREQLGLRRLRYTLPWQRVNPERGRWNWAWADRVMARARELGLTLVLNPIHFGTPTWLPQGFADPDFPQHAVEYFGRVAERYGDFIHFYTPHNEPLISALFSADFGIWPPYLHGLDNYLRVVENISRQIVLCVNEVRRIVPDAVMIHVDAGEYYATHATDPMVLADVRIRNLRRFLFYDLISGRVTPSHPLLTWLTRNGLPDRALAWFADNSIGLDVVGVDFYPHNATWLESIEGRIERVGDFGNRIVLAHERLGDSAAVRDAVGLPLDVSGVLRQYWQRYDRPVMLTETNYCGLDEHKVGYLNYSIAEMRRLREEGVPLLGYTWWPAIDHLNWNDALHERDSIHPVGLWSLKNEAGAMRRVEGIGVAAYRQAIVNAAQTIGDIAGSPPILPPTVRDTMRR